MLIFSVVAVTRGAWFIPSAEQLAFAREIFWPFVFSFASLGATASVLDRGPVYLIPDPVFRFIVVFAGLGVVVSIAGRSFLETAYPVILGSISDGNPAQMTMTVSGIGAENPNQACSRVVYVSAAVSSEEPSVRLCDIPKDLWSRLQIGDSVTLDGYHSPHGFHFNKIWR